VGEERRRKKERKENEKRKIEEIGKKYVEEKETWKMAFWNVAGVRNKDPEFW